MFVLDFQALNLACSFFLRDDTHILTRPPSDKKNAAFPELQTPQQAKILALTSVNSNPIDGNKVNLIARSRHNKHC